MNTPKIRFKGFTDDWEQRKLGEMVIDHNAGIYISKEDYGEGTNVIGVGNIYDRDIFDGEIYRLGPVNDDKFILEENDIIYGESSLVPEGIARTVCVGKNGAGSAFAWHTRRVKLDKNIVNSHVATLELNYLHEIRKYLVSVSTQTALTGMTTEGYFGATLTLPSVEEQQVISDYFKNIDYLITLHQRKCDETKQLKKFMLQKMFPKNGEKNPEIRFKGFTDDWEQRKLGELCNITTGKLDANAMVSDGQYDFYTSGIDVFKIDVAAFEGPAITIAGNGASVGYMHLADGKFNAYQRTYVLTDFLADRQFLNVAIGNELPNKIQEEVRGSGIPYIVLNMLTDLAIPFPSHEEQYAIGVYFQQLDHLITLHQRKCEKLKELKKFMLQNMFV